MMPELNQAGIDLVKKFEGLNLTVYQDIKGIYTIGYGHTKNVTKDTPSITQQQADDLLKSDLASACLDVLHYSYPAILNDNQFSALVSLIYNCGNAPIQETMGSYIRKSDFINAANEFDKWCHANGKVIIGLQLRRAAEKALFLS
jgi:lysozyme